MELEFYNFISTARMIMSLKQATQRNSKHGLSFTTTEQANGIPLCLLKARATLTSPIFLTTSIAVS